MEAPSSGSCVNKINRQYIKPGYWLVLGFSLISIITIFGCREDKLSVDHLFGRWEVANANRNGKPTLTLSDAFFEFQNDSIMVTNILREERSFGFDFDSEQIIQKGPVPIIYIIDEVFKDSMVLSTTISSFSFQFFLRRMSEGDKQVEN